MGSHLSKGRGVAGFVIAGILLAVAGCQSSDGGNVLNVGDKSEPPTEKVLESELRAYCPSVVLREGTASYRTYAKGAKDDPEKLVYQASLSDVTRSCARADGTMTIKVAAAGRVVTGPVGAPGAITMPIRVAAVRGDEVLYSQLHKYKVDVASGAAATQFVFKDPSVVIPVPEPNTVQIFVGYDEGPYDTK